MLFIAYSAYLLLLILNHTTQPESGCEVAPCFIFGCLHSRPQGPRFRHAQKRRVLGSKNGLSRIVMCMRHSVPKIEMKDDLNFLAIALSDKQISCMAIIDYRLFKCLDGKVVNKSNKISNYIFYRLESVSVIFRQKIVSFHIWTNYRIKISSMSREPIRLPEKQYPVFGI